MAIVIIDYGKPQYLDGVEMQYAIFTVGLKECLAYVNTLDNARLVAHALSNGEDVIIQGQS